MVKTTIIGPMWLNRYSKFTGCQRMAKVTVTRQLRRSLRFLVFLAGWRAVLSASKPAEFRILAREIRALGHDVRLIPPA